MSDPQPSSPCPPDVTGSIGDDARIEQLLVSGLDHYFAGRFDAAIHVWTRVLFLDRHHNRARAYIERARSAQAERHRQGDALLHEGFDAFDRGDVDRARRLMGQALALGASQDAALGVLGRIERLDVAGTGASDPPPRRTSFSGSRARLGQRTSIQDRRSGGRFWMTTAAGVVALATASWWLWSSSGWQDVWASPADQVQMSAIPETLRPPPVPTVSEAYFRRGQALLESGRLRDALTAFGQVPVGDPLRIEADRMRARIQRELLALALARSATPGPGGVRTRRPPE